MTLIGMTRMMMSVMILSDALTNQRARKFMQDPSIVLSQKNDAGMQRRKDVMTVYKR